MQTHSASQLAALWMFPYKEWKGQTINHWVRLTGNRKPYVELWALGGLKDPKTCLKTVGKWNSYKCHTVHADIYANYIFLLSYMLPSSFQCSYTMIKTTWPLKHNSRADLYNCMKQRIWIIKYVWASVFYYILTVLFKGDAAICDAH